MPDSFERQMNTSVRNTLDSNQMEDILTNRERVVAAAKVFERGWFVMDNGAGGSGAKCCRFCWGNSYDKKHKEGCEVVKGAEFFLGVGIEVDISF